MILHSLELTNYRGIGHIRLEFPDVGITVVEGPNEVGKSTLLEALRHLLRTKYSSKAAAVKAVRPVGSDEGTAVSAELTLGGTRFAVTKRFNVSRGALIEIPGQPTLSNDEAEAWLTDTLDEHLDKDLWEAMWLLQFADAAVAAEGGAPLRSALDAAAGGEREGAAEDSLFAAVEAEFQRYHTPTGLISKARTELADAAREAGEELAEARRLHDETVDLIAEFEEVDRGVGVAEADVMRSAAEVRLKEEESAAARRAAESVERLRAEVRHAEAARRVLAREVEERVRREDRLREREERTAELAGVADADSARIEALRERLDGIHAETGTAKVRVAEAEEALEVAAREVERIRRAMELRELRVMRARLDGIGTTLDEVEREFGAITVQDAHLEAVEAAGQRVLEARAAVNVAAAHIRVTASEPGEISIDGVIHPVGGDREVAVPVVSETGVRIGAVTVRVTPGGDAVDLASALGRAESDLAAALAAAGMGSAGEIRTALARGKDLEVERERLRGERAAILAHRDADDLRRRCEELVAAVGETEPGDEAAAEAVRTRAEEDLHAAREQFLVAEAARISLTELLREVTAKLETARAHIAERRAEDALERADIDAFDSAEPLEELRARADAAATVLEERTAELARHASDDLDPETARALAEGAARRVEVARERAAGLREKREKLRARIEFRGGQGLHERLAVARRAAEDAEAEAARVERRAAAAALLMHTLRRHRDEARSRYVRPFADSLAAVSRVVFGRDVEFTVDDELRVESRTLAGRTVPVTALSGGAREQLGILIRLAVARIIGRDGAVPVIIDDAFGYTDRDRMARMALVLEEASTDSQVILLTCAPDRYDTLAGVHRIDLAEAMEVPAQDAN